MSSIMWDPSLETGDALVDEQHRNIHELLNYLEASRDDQSEIADVLARLMEHVDAHFSTEEALMEREKYPSEFFETHVGEHRDLTSGARDMVLKFRLGEVTSTAPVLEFLRPWLAQHVHERDRALVDWMRTRGAFAELPEPWASAPLEPVRARG